MYLTKAPSTPGHLLPAAAALLAASSGGCLSALLNPARNRDPVAYCQSADLESGFILSEIPTAPPLRDGDLLSDFRDQVGRIAHERVHQSFTSPLLEYIAAEARPEVPVLVASEEGGMVMEDSRRDLSDQARLEALRIVRRAFSNALRHQEAYREIRNALRVSLGGRPFTQIEPGPVLEDPARDSSYGASRLFPGADLFRAVDPADVDTQVSLGVRPRLGFSWMGVYRFSWEPRDAEMIHRLEYAVGPIGVGMAYRIAEGVAADVGLGLQYTLGRMSVFTLSSSKVLRGDDAGGGPGERRVMAEFCWRF
jgi:hypothetical protein